MIVRKLTDAKKNGQVVEAETWTSRRLLLKKDGFGFSFHDTIIKAGTSTLIWYRNHLEAVYCIEGKGEVEVVDPTQQEGQGLVFPIEAGTLYALDGHERHFLRAESDMRMMCVFNPPLVGTETHDERGVYPLVE